MCIYGVRINRTDMIRSLGKVRLDENSTCAHLHSSIDQSVRPSIEVLLSRAAATSLSNSTAYHLLTYFLPTTYLPASHRSTVQCLPSENEL